MGPRGLSGRLMGCVGVMVGRGGVGFRQVHLTKVALQLFLADSRSLRFDKYVRLQ
jgi:hypothetical protein